MAHHVFGFLLEGLLSFQGLIMGVGCVWREQSTNLTADVAW